MLPMAQPLGALLGDRPLGEPVTQMDFKLTAVETAFAIKLRNMKFPTFLTNFVGNFVGGECRQGEDKLKLVDFFEFCF